MVQTIKKAPAGVPVAKLPKPAGRTKARLTTEPKEATAASARAEPKRRRRGEDVREKVLLAALECFGAFGFEGASTRAVAERAGISHTLVLYHFQSKENLWIATVEHALADYAARMKQTVAEAAGQSASVALGRFIEQFVRMSAAKPQVHRILTMEGNQKTDRMNWVIDHFIRDHFNFVRDLIRRGQVEGTVRQCDPARLYYHIIGAGGTPFTIATEYMEMTGRDVFSEPEILRTIAFIHEIVFV